MKPPHCNFQRTKTGNIWGRKWGTKHRFIDLTSLEINKDLGNVLYGLCYNMLN